MVDFDSVSLSNLNRQVLFNENNISEDKVIAAKRNLNLLNSDTNIQTIPKKVDKNFDYNLLDNYDVIIDCTDNFQSRSYVNEISLHNKIPLISGAAIKFEGQVAIFRNDLTDSPCYRCLYPNLPSRSRIMPGLRNFRQCNWVSWNDPSNRMRKITICSIDDTLSNKLMLVDLKKNEFRTIKLSKDEKCKFCK